MLWAIWCLDCRFLSFLLLLLLIFFACISDCRVAEVALGQERHPLLTKVEREEQASATIIMDEYQYFDVHQLIYNHNSLNRWGSNFSLCQWNQYQWCCQGQWGPGRDTFCPFWLLVFGWWRRWIWRIFEAFSLWPRSQFHRCGPS